MAGKATSGPDKQPSIRVTCPCCRRELSAVPGTESPLYQCGGGHTYSADVLLAEQTESATELLREVEATLEIKIALSGDLASKAQEEGQSLLLRYLERDLDRSRATLGFVRDQLREAGVY